MSEKNWWDKAKPFVELAGVIILAIYTVFTAFLYFATKRAVDVANSTLATTKTQFIQDERPWIWIVPKDTTIYYSSWGVAGYFHMQNVGKTPAVNVRIAALPRTFPPKFPPGLRADAAFNSLLANMGESGYQVGVIPQGQQATVPIQLPLNRTMLRGGVTVKYLRDTPGAWVEVGRIRYEDVLGNPYYSDICFGSYGSGIIAGCHNHNQLR